MNERRTKINARYATAKNRLRNADDEVRRVSQQRLAELMTLSEGLRLKHLDDDLLTPPDRANLLRSVAANLHRGIAKKSLSFSRTCLRWSWRRLRHKWPAAIVMAILVAPVVVIAWRNTGEVITLRQKQLSLVWKLPSGATEPSLYRAGDRLVVVSQSRTRALVRRWIAGQGYATATLDVFQ